MSVPSNVCPFGLPYQSVWAIPSRYTSGVCLPMIGVLVWFGCLCRTGFDQLVFHRRSRHTARTPKGSKKGRSANCGQRTQVP